MTESVFDRGLQLERTALAWQRTILTLAAGSLIAGRVLLPVFGLTSWAIAGAGLTVSVVLFVLVRQRYTRAHRHLTEVDERSLPGEGGLIVLCAAMCAAGGLAGLAFVLFRAL